MPTLAELDDPPAPRWRRLLIGIGAAAVVIALVLVFVMPAVHSSIVGESQDYDARLRQEDAYMKSVCTTALVVERDEDLCKCALAAEFPSLDCRTPFMAWTLTRQIEQCTASSSQAPQFCGCVDGLSNQLEALPANADDKARRAIVSRYARCSEMEDALYLPPVESLVLDSPSDADGESTTGR